MITSRSFGVVGHLGVLILRVCYGPCPLHEYATRPKRRIMGRAIANADKTSHWRPEMMKDTSDFLNVMLGRILLNHFAILRIV